MARAWQGRSFGVAHLAGARRKGQEGMCLLLETFSSGAGGKVGWWLEQRRRRKFEPCHQEWLQRSDLSHLSSPPLKHLSPWLGALLFRGETPQEATRGAVGQP